MSDDTDRLIDEIVKAVNTPVHLAPMKPFPCVICGVYTCKHQSVPEPVDVDNEAMTMIYEKIGMAAPVYPPCWADFWSATLKNWRETFGRV